MLLSWGRFAPFYQLFYALPYASTIRNPAKFLIVLSLATVILFGYGVQILNLRYLEISANGINSFSIRLKNWWTKVRGFDRNWTIVCSLALGASVLAWLMYAAQKPNLIRFLQSVGFPDEDMAKEMAAFSVGQAGWAILFFALAIGLCILILAGIFSGKRARLGGILLGVLLVADLGRANLPWIIHWNYKQKYASNPVIDFLKDKPYEHRVASLPFRAPDQFQLFEELYRIEWAQHHFPYYNIQSLDIIQMSRMPADLAAFEGALAFHGNPDDAWLITRRWELTNTRYLLGPAGFLDVMNEQLDPAQHRFRIVQRFNIVPKPGVDVEKLQEAFQRGEFPGEKLTAVSADDGPYALFDFTGALPRAKLYSHWQVVTNDDATLKILSDKNFDPQQTVLVSTPLPTPPAANSTNENSGAVDFKSYSPTKIIFDANATAPSVLLLNDKYDSNWRVFVDGQLAELLRCNFIMRGVYLAPGAHTVGFKFTLPEKPLYVTLAAIATGIFLIILLIFLQRRKPVATN
jgi:hypothetical protein